MCRRKHRSVLQAALIIVAEIAVACALLAGCWHTGSESDSEQSASTLPERIAMARTELVLLDALIETAALTVNAKDQLRVACADAGMSLYRAEQYAHDAPTVAETALDDATTSLNFVAQAARAGSP